MSELDKGIILDEWKEMRTNPYTGKTEEWKVIVGHIGIEKRADITPTALKHEIEPVITRDCAKQIRYKLKHKIIELAFEDIKLHSTEINKKSNIYETPLLGENEIILSPMKMAELVAKGSIIVSTKPFNTSPEV